ncbi:MAG: OadG family protein [Ruminococcus sp.]|nr:hypothetical protein [Oscillospiraceae bacterium]MBR2724863.1 OadG family protein [Ruminococcus sp.]
MQLLSIEQTTQVLNDTQKVAEESSGNESVIILVTGFVVVFMVLLLLIGIIKIYSGIVYSAQKKAENKKNKSNVTNAEPAVPMPSVAEETADEGLDLQTVAVITAAVEAFYSKGKKVRITGIRPANNNRNEWASAGLAQNIPAMRSEGLL